eukprot:scaffold11064_cov63-Phaeocystis_antarctica.AAC.4
MPAVVTSVGDCPLCLEPLKAATVTRCGHSFCQQCLHEWTAQKPTCPLCRTAVTDLAAPPAGRRANAPPGEPAQPHELSAQPRQHTVTPAQPSLREDMEAQHQRRSDAHRMRLDVEHRMAMYQSNSITISGRPYDSLPVVSLTELRNELDGNRRGLLSGPAMSSYLNV